MKYESMAHRILANSVALPAHDIDFQFNNLNGDPCWLWLGKFSSRGYPRISVRKDGKPRYVLVHRLVLSVFRGIELTRGLVAGHECDNPVCVNPMHLEPRTQSQNMYDCVRRGRHNSCQ